MGGFSRTHLITTMKLHLPTALRKALLACLAAFTLPVSVPITIGSSFWIISGERAQAVSWDLVVDEDFNGDSLDEDLWGRIPYVKANQTNNWRANQSIADDLVTFEEVDGNSAMRLWGKYGKYSNQNNQENTTEDLYACGGIYSLGTFSFQYGYVEVRAKYECAQGVWPAIWMMPAGNVPVNGVTGTWPRPGEIDIMEHLNSENKFYQTLHWWSDTKNNHDENVSVAQPSLSNKINDWHTYGMEWHENSIAFYLDGAQTGKIEWTSDGYTISRNGQVTTVVFTEAQKNLVPFGVEGNEFYLILDQQIGGGWPGQPDDASKSTLASSGVSMWVDYVKVYSASEKSELEERTWQASTGTWKEGSEDEWGGGTFASGQEAVFGEAGAGTVSVDGTVHAGNMIVQTGGYTFSAKEGSAGSIEVVGTLDMQADANFNCGLKLGGNPGCSLKGSGAVNYAGSGILTINRINPSEFTGRINITGGGKLLISTDFEAGEGASVNLGENGMLAFDNNNLVNGGAGADTVFSADVTGLRAVEAKGGFTVTLTGNVTGGGALTMGQYNGAGFTACLVFDGDVSGFTSFVTSANQYNISHYPGTSGRAAYAFNAGLALGADTTFDVAKNAANQDGWIELGSTSRLTGNGTIVKTGEGDLRIEGDTSGYTGKIKLQAGGLVLNGTDGQHIDLSLENAEAVAQLKGTGGRLNSVGVGEDAVSGQLQMEAASSWTLTTVNLAAGKTLAISGAGACAIGTLTSDGGSLTVEQGSTVELMGTYSSGAITLNGGTLELSKAGSLTSLALGAGARVETELTDGTLNFGDLSVSEVTRAAGDAVLSLTGMLDGLKLQASSVDGTLHLALSDEFIKTKLFGEDGYELFVDGTPWQDHVVFDNATYGSRLKISGNNLVIEALSGLYWAGTDDSHVWNAETSNTDWKNGDESVAFTGSQDVVFMPGEGVSTTVELAGTLAPGNVTVGQGIGWVFSGSGNLNATGRITVGGEGGSAELTLSGTGTVISNGLSLVGEGTKLIITSAPTSGAFNFKHMELGTGTELVLQGAGADATHWTRNQAASYASGAGSIVLAGAGVLNNSTGGTGILWAFFGNTDVGKERIGNLRLSKNGDSKTTLALNGEQGNDNQGAEAHGIGVVENLWVDDECSLVVRSRALGVTQGECTLHLTGDGSSATYTTGNNEGGGTADAALVLGFNTSDTGQSADRKNNIYWNVATAGNTSIGVLADAAGNAYTWTLMKELNVGEGHTLTKKGAGTLKLDAGSTLVGSGKIVVSEGQLGLSGNMTEFTGSVQAGAEAGKTLTLEDANISAGSIAIGSDGTLSFGEGTNFSAGSLTLSGSFSVTGGAVLTGDGVINVAKSGTLSLAAETYSGMHVGLLDDSGTAASNRTESTLVLAGGSFTGSVNSVHDRGTIKVTGETAGTISITGDTMLRVGDGGSFTGTITLAGESGQKLGIFGASGDNEADYAITLNRVESTAGEGILVAGKTRGGVTVAEASGLSEVWVGGPAGTSVSIGTLTAQGMNHSFTMDNGVFPTRWPNPTGGDIAPWAGNSGKLIITGTVTGYTSFTAKKKGTAVTDWDLIFQGEVSMGDGAEVTINATNTEHDGTAGTNDDKYATILFDATSSITGNGSIAKQGAGKLVLAGSIAEGSWSLNVQGGTVELGKSGQGSALDYSLTGLSIAQGAVVESKGACHLTLTGALEAEQGTIKMSAADSSLALHGSENKLGTLELGEEASGVILRMGGSADAFAQLALGAFTPGEQTLTLALDGLDEWIAAQTVADTYELTLFSGEGVEALVAAIGGNIEAEGFDCTLNSNGTLTISVDVSNLPLTWSGDGTTMIWTSQEGGNVWGDGHDTAFDSTKSVVFAGTSTEPITVTLGEDITLQRGMTVKKGEGVEGSQSYTFDLGDHNLSVGQNLSIEEGISATLTGTGYVHSEGLSLSGQGTKLIMTSAPSGDGKYIFKHMELGAGTELVLRGADAANYLRWDLTNSGNNNYASGAGSIVLEGTGILQNGMSQAGILWAFFWNREGTHPGQTIGNLILRSYEGTGTTLFIDGEMGIETDHAIGVVENFWVEDGSSLVIKCRVLGKTTGNHSNTLHLKGNGSNASNGGVDADAALVLGTNGAGDGTNTERSKIYWNIKAESDTSIDVWVASTTPECAEWTLMKELNVGEHTLTKKGAGTLKLDAGGTLVGTGDIVVSDGALQVGANMGGYRGTIRVQGGSGLTLSANNPTVFAVELSGGATMTMQTGGTIETLTVNGAGVSVADAQILTVTTLNGGEGGLTSLSLGAGSTLDVTGGTMSLKGELSLSGEADLNWGGAGKITLGQGFSLSSDGGTLHIHLSDEFMGQFAGHNGELDFFNYDGIDWNSSWAGVFTLETDDTSTYRGLRIDDQGHLAWTEQGQGSLHWAGTADNYVWSADGDNSDWKNGDAPAAFTGSQDVIFTPGDGVSREVTLVGELTPGNVTVSQGTGWVFSGEGNLNASGVIAVGGEDGAAELTLSGTGAVHSAGLSLVGEGTKLVIETTDSGTGALYSFGHMELGEGTELVLQGANAANYQHWTRSTNNYASGAGSIVLDGTGIIQNEAGQAGILWAFFWSSESTDEGRTIGNLKLRSHGEDKTTLIINGEMGSETGHGIGVVENLWVENDSSLMIRCRALGVTTGVRANTLHLTGDGSGASFRFTGAEGEVAADAALVLGSNTSTAGDQNTKSDIYWNIKAEADTSISVLADTNGNAYTWTLMKELNVGEHTLTKKGAGILKLDASSTLVGTGDIVVSDGGLQVGANMGGYTGTIRVQGGSGLTLSANNPTVSAVDLSGGATMTMQAGGTIKTLTVDGAGVSVADAQTLTITTLNSGEGGLTSLSLGDGSTLTVAGGTMSLKGALSLSGEANLNWGGSDKIALGQGFSLSSDGGTLRIHLSRAFMKQFADHNGEMDFFDCDDNLVWDSSWSNVFILETDDTSNYGELYLDEQGHLAWAEPWPSGMHWAGTADNHVWSTEGGNADWKDGGNSVAFSNADDVTFTPRDDVSREVTLAGELAPGNVTVGQGTGWVFNGSGNLNATGRITVGGEGGSAELTLSGTGAVHSAGLSLSGDGTKLTINTDNSDNNALYSFGHMELGEGTELVLQGANAAKYQHWTRSTNNYVSGAGSIVLEGTGVMQNGGQQAGILWAFFWNSESTHEGQTIGNLKLRSHGEDKTTLIISGEMGNANGHGIGVVENLWVENDSSLVVRCRALGVTTQTRTLHLAGDGSGEEGGDAALVLGSNPADGDAATRSNIYWNITAEADTSIGVLKDTTTDTYPWTLMKELNVGEYTLTKKGAGTLKLDAGGTLVGAGDIVVSDGALQVDANMSEYTGTIKIQGGSGLTLSADASAVNVNLENETAEGNVLNLSGTGTLQSVSLGEGTTGGKLQMGENSSWTLKSVNMGAKALTIGGTGVCAIEQLIVEDGSLTVEQGGTVKLGTPSAAATINLTSLTLGAGARLETDLTNGALNFGALSAASDAVLRLNGALNGLKLSATSVDGSLLIELADEFVSSLIGQDGYELFGNDSPLLGQVTIENAHYADRLHLQGNKVTVDSLEGLYWAGTGSNVWNAEASNTDWKNGDAAAAFTEAANVVFMPGNGVSKTVELVGELAPGNVTVGQGTGWVFSGSGNLNATGIITVGGEGGPAELTLSGTGYVHSEGLSLVGSGTKLVITSVPSGNAKYLFKHMELGAGTELVLRGAAAANHQRWDLTNSGNNNYASGAGSVVLEGTGILRNGMSQAGILWAFFWNSESTHEGQTIGNLKLRSNGGDRTTLILDGEMGNANGHGIGVVENLWVESDSSLVLRSRALGVTTGTRANTLRLAGNGSGAAYSDTSHEGDVSTDAALVLGWNRDEDHAGSIYWNVTAEANTSISVLKDTGDEGSVYTWTLMKELNVGEYTLTKKGAGTLKLDAGGTLVGTGDIVVSDGALQVGANMGGYKGTIRVQGGSGLTLSADASTVSVSLENGTAGGNVLNLSGTGALKNVSLGGSATSGTLSLAESANRTLSSVTLEEGQTLTIQGAGSDGTQSRVTVGTGDNVALNGGTLQFDGVNATVKGILSGENSAVHLSGGATMTMQTSGAIGTLTVNGAGVSVAASQTLKVTTLNGGGGGLTSLSLGAGSTLDVTDGSMNLKGALSLNGSANLNWGGKNKITLGQDFSLNANGANLHIHLSDEFMGQFADRNGELDFFRYENSAIWDSSWAGVFVLETDDKGTYRDLHIDELGHLAWVERSGVQWDDTSGSTWSDNSSSGWEEVNPDQPTGGRPAGQDVHFVASSTGNKDVTISGEVTPTNVYVEEGEFTFRSDNGGGIYITENEYGGMLVVGGDGNEAAKLTLATANINLPSIELKNNGSLVLADDAALTVSKEDGGLAENTTKIKFRGGVLEYSGDQKLTDADVSRFVASQQDGSNSAVKVKVDAESAYRDDGVTWGSKDAEVADNGGLTHALADEKGGVEKSGSGSFTLEWQDAGDVEYKGAIAVTGGSLEYKVHTGSKVTMSGDANVSKADPETNEEVKLALTVAEGSRGTLDYAGQLTGDGSVELRADGGKLVMSGDNSKFGGKISIANGSIRVGNDGALGGDGTTLVLSGGNLRSSDEEEMMAVRAGTVQTGDDAASGSTLGNVELTGSVTGSGRMTAADNATVVLSGSVAEFSGHLNTGASGIWQLSGQALAGDVTGTVGGRGTVAFEGDAVFSGEVQDSVTLKSIGEGRLVVASLDTSGDAKLGGNVQLGGDGMHAQWNGKTVMENSVITLANASLAEGGLNRLAAGVRVLVDTSVGARLGRSVGDSGVVDVNGMAGENLQGIAVNSGGQLQGVSGTYAVSAEKKLTLCIETPNISQSAEDGTALITGRDGFTLDLSGTEGLSINFDNVAGEMLSFFKSQEDAQLFLHLLDGGKLAGTEDVSVDDVFADSILKPFITQMSFDGGNLVLVGNAVDVYVVNEGEPLELEDPNVLNASKSTVLLDDLTLNYDGETDSEDAILHNLLGTYGTTLYLQNSNSDAKRHPLTVTLDNTYADDIDPDGYDKEDGTTVQGQHTVFNGNIDGGEGVNVRKVGKGTLTVGGNYRLADGVTILEEGSIKLRGVENVLVDLRFAYNTERDAKGGEDERGLTLQGGRTTLSGSVQEVGSVTDGNRIAVTSGAELVFTGEQEMKTTRITGDGSGSLTLAQGESQAASLKLAGKPGADGNPPTQLSGVAVNMGGPATTLDIGQNAADVTKLSGDGVLQSDRGGSLTVEGGAFSGTLAASDGAEGAGTLVVKNGGSFALSNVSSAGGATRATAWDVKLGEDSKLKVDVSRKSTSDPTDKLVLGDVDLGNGCMTVDFGNNVVHGNALEAYITGCGERGILELHSDGAVENGEDVSTGISVSGELADDFVNHVKFSGAGNFVKDREWKVGKDGMLTVTTRDAEDNKFERAMPNAGKNGLAGAQMMWESLKDKSQEESFFEAMLNPSSDYAKLTYELVRMFDNQEVAALERSLTAVAGSSIATIGPAVMEDMHRQLKAIRNRTTTMSDGTSEELPASHIWINGETGYYKLSSDGYLPGYSLSNWGGTLGVDVDISDEATVGIALSAMYGDLKPSSADSATGNLDTTYLSAFLRANSGAWIHTIVVSGGIADINLDRTVHYGSGSYRTSGNTNGYSLGAIYELGYTLPMSPEGTMAIQPVFNVEVRHASVKGYTESDSDVALRVDGIKQDVFTFGLGARVQAAVGGNAFNRRAVFEARALAKLDAGDRSGKARNGIIGNSTSAEVESAETGAAGFEIGAGISVPVGSQSGSVFMDASFEWRDGWSSVDASAGYRVSF